MSKEYPNSKKEQKNKEIKQEPKLKNLEDKNLDLQTEQNVLAIAQKYNVKLDDTELKKVLLVIRSMLSQAPKIRERDLNLIIDKIRQTGGNKTLVLTYLYFNNLENFDSIKDENQKSLQKEEFKETGVVKEKSKKEVLSYKVIDKLIDEVAKIYSAQLKYPLTAEDKQQIIKLFAQSENDTNGKFFSQNNTLYLEDLIKANGPLFKTKDNKDNFPKDKNESKMLLQIYDEVMRKFQIFANNRKDIYNTDNRSPDWK